MTLKQRRFMILNNSILNLRTKAFINHRCLVNLTEHKKDKEKWHFCSEHDGFIYKSVIDEQYVTLKIAILRYRILIKVNWTKQEQIKKTLLKILDELNDYFLWNIAVNSVKKDDWHQFYR